MGRAAVGADMLSQRMGPAAMGCCLPAEQRECRVPRALRAPAMAPLYIGFGSMKVDGTGLSTLLAQALQQVLMVCPATDACGLPCSRYLGPFRGGIHLALGKLLVWLWPVVCVCHSTLLQGLRIAALTVFSSRAQQRAASALCISYVPLAFLRRACGTCGAGLGASGLSVPCHRERPLAASCCSTSPTFESCPLRSPTPGFPRRGGGTPWGGWHVRGPASWAANPGPSLLWGPVLLVSAFSCRRWRCSWTST